MFRKENGVTLVALVVTIIVLLILAGVTVSMVLGEDGIIGQASDASEAQERAAVVDQASVAYATVRTEEVARKAGVSDSTSTTVDYTVGMAVEMVKTNAFNSVKYSTADKKIEVQVKADGAYYVIDVTTPASYTISNASATATLSSGTAASSTTTY